MSLVHSVKFWSCTVFNISQNLFYVLQNLVTRKIHSRSISIQINVIWSIVTQPIGKYNKWRHFYPNNKTQLKLNIMELNTSGTNFTFRNYLQEEDPRTLAKSYMMYKIGEFNYLTKMVLDGFPLILIYYHKVSETFSIYMWQYTHK